ncbi:PAS domain-containing sensor histidine kinase [Candidatus Parcubacteria bacterium]|nr:PAS domain-containing sensor histidine kinase [Candidatus Parcubacteria bacterium]
MQQEDHYDLITVIKQLQESAKETVEERIKAEALFTSIGDGAMVTDEKGRVTKVNKTALELLGFSRKELMGKWFPGAVVALNSEGEPIEAMERPLTLVFLSGKTVSQKARYVKKDGGQLPVYITVSPIVLEDKPIGAIEVFRDISREDEIDRLKSEFISTASHQLRTPLSAINTYANMLSGGFQGELTKGQEKYLNIIIKASARMNELISTLLDISRIEAGKISHNPEKIDILALINGIITEQKRMAEIKKIKITVQHKKNLPVVISDPLLLGEIYSNLISNAIKYTPKKGRVDIELKVSQNELIFSVKDTGYGIPAALHNRIFTKFFRAENAARHETTGTGLGLYLAWQIAEVLGGRLWFKSRENVGSTFYFALPIEADST